MFKLPVLSLARSLNTVKDHDFNFSLFTHLMAEGKQKPEI
jgi:hypothetical protein